MVKKMDLYDEELGSTNVGDVIDDYGAVINGIKFETEILANGEFGVFQ